MEGWLLPNLVVTYNASQPERDVFQKTLGDSTHLIFLTDLPPQELKSYCPGRCHVKRSREWKMSDSGNRWRRGWITCPSICLPLPCRWQPILEPMPNLWQSMFWRWRLLWQNVSVLRTCSWKITTSINLLAATWCCAMELLAFLASEASERKLPASCVPLGWKFMPSIVQGKPTSP